MCRRTTTRFDRLRKPNTKSDQHFLYTNLYLDNLSSYLARATLLAPPSTHCTAKKKHPRGKCTWIQKSKHNPIRPVDAPQILQRKEEVFRRKTVGKNHTLAPTAHCLNPGNATLKHVAPFVHDINSNECVAQRLHRTLNSCVVLILPNPKYTKAALSCLTMGKEKKERPPKQSKDGG